MGSIKYIVLFVALIFIISLQYSTKQSVDLFDEPTPKQIAPELFSVMGMTCALFNTLLPIATMISITLSGIVFAIGQMLGAEVRARANVYATNLLMGSVIAGTVTVLTPTIVKALIPTLDMSQCAASSSTSGGGITQDDLCKECLDDCSDECEVQCAGISPVESVAIDEIERAWIIDERCYNRCIESCTNSCNELGGPCNPYGSRHGLPVRAEDKLD